VAAPGPLGDALRLVHGLATDPATALLDFAEDAGVPALAELRLVLPDGLEAGLAGWLNRYLTAATVEGDSPQVRIAELDALIRSVLLSWELRSTLELPGGATGLHSPVALAFASPVGLVVVPVDVTAPVTAGVGVSAGIAWPSDGTAAVVTISEHAMGLPFGRYALQGLEAMLLARFGAPDLAAALAGLVGCQALAAEVAGRCTGPLCVGHQAELLAICQGGVGEAAARIEAQLRALDFEAIDFRAGTASPPGALLPGAVEVTALQAGVWTASIDLGQGAEPATTTFTAVR
jgi:hypothetical protein